MSEETIPTQNDQQKLVHMAKTEDARFLSFAREYVGLLATVAAIPLVSSVFEVIPEPIEEARLSILSSFICLIVFASCFLLRGVLKRWSDADNWKRFLPWAGVIGFSIAAIIFTVAYFAIGQTHPTWKISTYLFIHPCLIFGLGIFLVTAFTQQDAHNIQSFIDADPYLKKEAPRILRLLEDYVEYRRLCNHNKTLEKVGREFIEPQQRNLELLREGRLEAGRHDAIMVNGLLAASPMTGFHAVSDRDLEFWANMEGDFMAREYFRLNQHLLTRKGTMVSRVFILSTADLERTDKVVPILRQHESAGIAWAVVIFEELNPTIANYQNKPLDFALLTSTGNEDKSEDGIKAISYFRDYRETSRRYTVVFCTPTNVNSKDTRNNQQEIKNQLELYRSLFVHCWLASSSFKLIFEHPALFGEEQKNKENEEKNKEDAEKKREDEEPIRDKIAAANQMLNKRLASLPEEMYGAISEGMKKKSEEQVFLHEISDAQEIDTAIEWLLKVREAHCEWQKVEMSHESQ